MRSLRRSIGIMLLASLAGSQPAAASCAMVPGAEASVAGGSAEPVHAHHAAAVAEVPGPGAVPDTVPDPSCGVTMPCAVAAPTVIVTIPAAPFVSDVAVLLIDAAHTPPALAFEPPPPRPNLI